MVNQVNWDIAPEDATHHGHVNNPDIIAWYKYEPNKFNPSNVGIWYYWYSDSGILNSIGWTPLAFGEAPLQLPVTPRPKYTAPSIVKNKWIPGETLPPVGSIVYLTMDTLAEHSTLYKFDSYAGDEVEIIAHFQSDSGVEVAAYLYKGIGGKYVRQAIAKMFKEIDTPEEKKERQREKNIQSLISEFDISGCPDLIDFLVTLYDDGRLKV